MNATSANDVAVTHAQARSIRGAGSRFFPAFTVSLIVIIGCGRIGFDRNGSHRDAAAPEGSPTIDVMADISTDIPNDANDGSVICGNHCGTLQPWLKRFGDIGPDTGIAIDTDSFDNFYLGGTFSGAVDFGGGPLDELPSIEIILAAFDSTGVHRWSNVPTGPSGGGPWAIHDLATDSTQGIVFTGTPSPGGNNEAFLMTSYDSNGSYRWGTYNGDSLDLVMFSGAASDAQNRVYMAGYFSGQYDFGCGSALSSNGNGLDVFVMSLDATTGACQWANAYGGPDIQLGTDIAVQADGTLFITGYFRGSFSAGGAALTSAGSEDIFVASYTREGVHRWSFAQGSSGVERGQHIAITSDQRAIVTGIFAQSVDFGTGTLTSVGGDDVFIASFSAADGQLQWANQLGGTSNDVAHSIQVSPFGGVHLCGHYFGTVDFGDAQRTSLGDSDAFVVAYELGTGLPLSSRSYGGIGADSCRGLAFDSTGAMYLTGGFSNAVDFDGTPLTSAGGTDIFVLKTAPVWSCTCP